MDVDAVPIEGRLEVVALHRFLFESQLEDITSVYAGGPFIAAMQLRLVVALELADPGTGWSDWRKRISTDIDSGLFGTTLPPPADGGMTSALNNGAHTYGMSSHPCACRRNWWQC